MNKLENISERSDIWLRYIWQFICVKCNQYWKSMWTLQEDYIQVEPKFMNSICAKDEWNHLRPGSTYFLLFYWLLQCSPHKSLLKLPSVAHLKAVFMHYILIVFGWHWNTGIERWEKHKETWIERKKRDLIPRFSMISIPRTNPREMWRLSEY